MREAKVAEVSAT